MRFSFNTFNHCEDGRRCLEDLTLIMSAQLRALGHEVVSVPDRGADATFLRDGFNILYESFADPGTIDHIALARSMGARFVYVATEEPTDEGCFGGRLDNAMRERQQAFVEAARYADGILHLMAGERINEWYSRLAPASYAELGHARELVYGGPDVEPDAAFGFYGQLTPRRAQIFDEMRRRFGEDVLVLPFITHSSAARDAAMRACRVVLQVRAHDSMETISSSRCATALSLGRPVVAEPHAHAAPWDRVVHVSSTIDGFYEDAAAALDHWRGIYAVQLARFASELTPEVCLGEPLRRIGIS